MTTQLTVANGSFNQWLLVKGYLDKNGELSIKLRQAQALYLQEDIVKHKETIEESFTAICENLWSIYKEQYWVELGFNNFTEFLASPEIDLPPSIGYGYKEIARLMEEGKLEKQRVKEIGPSKARTLLPVISKEDDEEVVEEWLSRAETLNNLDLQDAVAGKEIQRYSGSGKLNDIIQELKVRGREAFWEEDVHLRIRTL
jgi:hypothetical protein